MLPPLRFRCDEILDFNSTDFCRCMHIVDHVILDSYSGSNRLAPLVPEHNNCVTLVSVFAVCVLKFCEIWVFVSCKKSEHYLGY